MSCHDTPRRVKDDVGEGGVREYVSRPSFLWLGFFIIAWFFVTVLNLSPKGEITTTAPSKGSDKKAPPTRPQPYFTHKLAPYYRRSHLVRLTAIALYLGVLALQLHHGARVLISWWRLLIVTLAQWPPEATSGFLYRGSLAWSTLVVVAGGPALAGFGVLAVLFQLTCLAELVGC